MAPNKKRQANSPGPDDAAVRKRTKSVLKDVTEKNAKKKKKPGTKEKTHDGYEIKKRSLAERVVMAPEVKDVDLEETGVEKPVLDKPIMKVKNIEVDEEVPRKRETTTYDPTEREMWTIPIKIEDLDLHVSHLDDSPNPAEVELARYTAALKATAEKGKSAKSADEKEGGEKETNIAKETKTTQEAFQRKRWINKGPTIYDINDAPQDWDDNEPDIHPLDYVNQIKRCHERIQDNILPAVFEAKIKRFEELKSLQDEVQARRQKEYPGLDSATLTRVEGLVQMRDLLAKQGNDRFEQMINIEALIAAYTEGKLKWYGNGFVTYWSCSIQRSEPRGFKMEEFACLSRHFPNKSFWVEGVTSPGPEHCGMASGIGGCHQYVDDPAAGNPQHNANYLRISVKLPDGYNYTRLTFMRDTGASFMTLYENDLQYLQDLDAAIPTAAGILAPSPPVLCHGYVTLTNVGGPVVMPLTLVTVCIHRESDGYQFTCWDNIQAVLMPGSRILGVLAGGASTIPRLDGPWPRWKLFYGGAPTPLDHGTTYIAQTRKGLTTNIPPTTPGTNYANIKLNPMGPPVPLGAFPAPGTWFPGPSLLEPADFIPPPPPAAPPAWAGPPVFPPPGNITFPVGDKGPAPVLVPGTTFRPAAIPAYTGASPSFWDL